MLALTRELVRAGHAVRMVAPPDFGAQVEATGAEHVPIGTSMRAFMQRMAGPLQLGGLAFMRAMYRFGVVSLREQCRLLPEAARGMDRILTAGTIVAAGSAAKLHGIPFRAVAYTPAVLPSPESSPALFPLQLRSPVGNRLLWWAALGSLQATLRPALERQRRALGLPPIDDLPREVLSPRPLLAADAPLAPAPRSCPLAPETIRCLHPLRGDPLPPKLEAFLQAGPPPVYLGFGSMPDPDPRSTTARLLAALSQLGCRAVLSSGWAGLGEGALPEGVEVVGSVSHAELFPRMAAVVHHGGAGTTHTAARSGVPQIVIPHVLDQFYFARRVHDLGVSPPALPRKRLRVDQLVATVRATLDNELLRQRAQELQSRLAELGPVVPDLERVLAP